MTVIVDHVSVVKERNVIYQSLLGQEVGRKAGSQSKVAWLEDRLEELSHLSPSLHLQRMPGALHDVPCQVLAVSEAEAEVSGVENILQSLQHLSCCRLVFLYRDVFWLTLGCLHNHRACRPRVLRSCETNPPRYAFEGQLDEVALVLDRGRDSLEAEGEGGSNAKVWQDVAEQSFVKLTAKEVMPLP